MLVLRVIAFCIASLEAADCMSFILYLLTYFYCLNRRIHALLLRSVQKFMGLTFYEQYLDEITNHI